MRLQNLVYCLGSLELLLKLVKIGLDDLNDNVVNIVLDEVLHAVS